jgi:hypothetical protein
MSTLSGGPNVVVDGLVLWLDAANTKSYVSGSTSITSLNRPAASSIWSGSVPTPGFQNGNIILNTGTYLTSFPGVSQSLFPQSSGSISIWINAIYGIEQGGGGKGYFDSYDLSRNHIFIRSANGINQISLQISGAAQYNSSYSHTTAQGNTWYNYAITYITGTSRNFKVYINGTLVNNTTPASASWVPDGQNTGYGNQVGSTMSGSYGPLLIYNKVLSQAEILQNYNALKSRFNLT